MALAALRAISLRAERMPRFGVTTVMAGAKAEHREESRVAVMLPANVNLDEEQERMWGHTLEFSVALAPCRGFARLLRFGLQIREPTWESSHQLNDTRHICGVPVSCPGETISGEGRARAAGNSPRPRSTV